MSDPLLMALVEDKGRADLQRKILEQGRRDRFIMTAFSRHKRDTVEIAEALGVPENVVANRMAYLRDQGAIAP